jgi:cyclic pyranopterin phosphate synthase
MMMLDRLERPLRDLRISVTDRCNLRCRYCMPREVFGPGFAFLPRAELLGYEEIARIVRVLAAEGVRKVRLTGGEPLLRRGLERLVEMLAVIDGVEDIALTTNGLLLAGQAKSLSDAGLRRVTVSLDALDEGVLHAISDMPLSPARILAAIDAAAAAGLSPVKVNMVVRRGLNDCDVLAMAEHFRHSGHVLRFIEYMDVGSTNGWRREDVVASAEIRAALESRWPLEALAPARGGEVARRYRYRDGAGEIGFISSVSEPFCGGCTRARLSADGKLYTCLFATGGHDVRALVRGGHSDEALTRAIRAIWSRREDRYSAERAELPARHRRPARDSPAPGAASVDEHNRERGRARVEMSYIGG